MGSDRIYYNAGFKSFDITKNCSRSEVWFERVERSRKLMRTATVSLKVMKWVTEVFNAVSKEHNRAIRRWNMKDHYAEFYCNLKYNEYGRYISFIVVQGENKSVIITPEISLNAGWGDIAQKIQRLINVPEKERNIQIVRNPQLESSYTEAVRTNR